ncbi:hypothetical protein [Sphaerotilus mobilis]|uniref:Uncharacterized protein n=1 Tax=Sphaerotilus mobilis TaxID=47994 RepID=A0A4Q7LBI8_9BURK|nr:hypothetical protein [Sphaerotilus mobilis]RZS47424.1 hypothetical protein EV685_3628 [Sphaerotilus mobilis]
MGFLDALDHLLNFMLPALVLAALTAALAKLLWRDALAGVAWQRLALHAGCGGLIALVGGLLLQGRDGRMSTWAALVVANAIGLWWVGFGPGRRRA